MPISQRSCPGNNVLNIRETGMYLLTPDTTNGPAQIYSYCFAYGTTSVRILITVETNISSTVYFGIARAFNVGEEEKVIWNKVTFDSV